jgi:hypothetical protein
MSGVTHPTFSERVLDARTKANQVPVLDAKLELALEYYEVSAKAWSLKIGPDSQVFQRSIQIGRKLDSELFKACKAMTELTRSADASFKTKSPPGRSAVRNARQPAGTAAQPAMAVRGQPHT